MTCTTAHQLIQEGLDAHGGPGAALEHHLATCADCRAYQEGIGRVVSHLFAKTLSAAAPPELMGRLGLSDEGNMSKLATFASQRHPLRRWIPLGIAVAGMLFYFNSVKPGPTPVATETAVVASSEGADLDTVLTYFGAESLPESDQLPL
ncbi:hypothetical protein J7643_04515 [bacterium]|nr:hypothetical protein [bacterium]